MKMTKIESARIMVKQKGDCRGINCNHCFCHDKCFKDRWQDLDEEEGEDIAVKYAKAYIKRHKSKSKKKDHILDTTKKVDTYHKKLKKDYVELKPVEEPVKVTRPNFRKYLRDKIDMKVRVTPELILELEKICKDEGVYHWNRQSFKIYLDNPYMLINSRGDCEYSVVFSYKGRENTAEYNPETDTLVEKVEEPKQVGIDNSDVTLAQYEPVKDCPVNSEIPQPVKLPDFVYSASKNGVGFIDTKNRTFNTNDKGELLINDKPCFATPEEALQFANKLWNGEGK